MQGQTRQTTDPACWMDRTGRDETTGGDERMYHARAHPNPVALLVACWLACSLPISYSLLSPSDSPCSQSLRHHSSFPAFASLLPYCAPRPSSIPTSSATHRIHPRFRFLVFFASQYPGLALALCFLSSRHAFAHPCFHYFHLRIQSLHVSINIGPPLHLLFCSCIASLPWSVSLASCYNLLLLFPYPGIQILPFFSGFPGKQQMSLGKGEGRTKILVI